MHGSLAPGRPGLNRAVGRLALTLYAGFSYDRLTSAHWDHHKAPGSAERSRLLRGPPDRLLAVVPGSSSPAISAGRRSCSSTPSWACCCWRACRSPTCCCIYALPAIAQFACSCSRSAPSCRTGTTTAGSPTGTTAERTIGARSPASLSCYHFGYHHEHHLSPTRCRGGGCRRGGARGGGGVGDERVGDPGLIVIGSAAAMEVVAWAAHRYIMHGPAWAWHRDHHEPHDNARWRRTTCSPSSARWRRSPCSRPAGGGSRCGGWRSASPCMARSTR